MYSLALLLVISSFQILPQQRCPSVVGHYQQDIKQLNNQYGHVRFNRMKILYESVRDAELMFPQCFRSDNALALVSQRRSFTRRFGKQLDSVQLYQDAYEKIQRAQHIRTLSWGWSIFGASYLGYSIAMGAEISQGLYPPGSTVFHIKNLGFIPLAGPIINGIYLVQQSVLLGANQHVLIGMGILNMLVGVLQGVGFTAILWGHTRLANLGKPEQWTRSRIALSPWFRHDGAGLSVAGRF